jgi:hypothetical protein
MRALSLLLALTLAAVAVPLPGLASEAQDDLLFEAVTPGSGAFGVRVTTGASGAYRLEVASNGAHQGSVDNFGAWLYDAGKAFQFGIAIGGGLSKDRTIATLGGAGLDGAAQPPEGTLALDLDPLDGGSVRFDITTPPHSTRHAVAWGAGLQEARLRIWGPADTQVVVQQGAAYALGDPELRQGGPNVEVQRSYAPFQYVGAKALLGSGATIQAQHGGYGLWASHAFKMVCPQGFATPSCRPVDVGRTCSGAGLPCDSAKLSWQGPGGAGGSGGRSYSLVQHHGPGAYTFQVDHKVDAYGPWRSVASAWMGLGEDTSTLAFADVAIP